MTSPLKTSHRTPTSPTHITPPPTSRLPSNTHEITMYEEAEIFLSRFTKLKIWAPISASDPLIFHGHPSPPLNLPTTYTGQNMMKDGYLKTLYYQCTDHLHRSICLQFIHYTSPAQLLSLTTYLNHVLSTPIPHSLPLLEYKVYDSTKLWISEVLVTQYNVKKALALASDLNFLAH